MNKAVKKSVFVFAIISVVVAMAVMLVGCNKVDKKLQSMQNSISSNACGRRQYLLCGGCRWRA